MRRSNKGEAFRPGRDSEVFKIGKLVKDGSNLNRHTNSASPEASGILPITTEKLKGSEIRSHRCRQLGAKNK